MVVEYQRWSLLWIFKTVAIPRNPSLSPYYRHGIELHKIHVVHEFLQGRIWNPQQRTVTVYRWNAAWDYYYNNTNECWTKAAYTSGPPASTVSKFMVKSFVPLHSSGFEDALGWFRLPNDSSSQIRWDGFLSFKKAQSRYTILESGFDMCRLSSVCYWVCCMDKVICV